MDFFLLCAGSPTRFGQFLPSPIGPGLPRQLANARERPSPSQIHELRVWCAFALLALIWGSSYLFIRIGVRRVAPESLVFGRLFVGWVVIAIIVAATGQSVRSDRRTLALFAIQGTIATAIPFALISYGEIHVASGIAAVLNSTVPIVAILLAALFIHDEPLSWSRGAGTALGLIGVVVLMSRGPFGGHGSVIFVGEILITLSSVSYGAGVVFARRMLRSVPSMTVAFWAVLFAAISSGIAAAVTGPTPLLSLNGDSVFAILWLGVLGSGIAYVLSYFVIASWGASRASLVAFLLPAVGLALGVIFLAEPFDWRIAVGLLLILSGIGLVTTRRFAPLGPPRVDPSL
jgi:drug/metabolite transporter (DMT)-like permease